MSTKKEKRVKSETPNWIDSAWKESKKMMVENYIKAILQEVARGGSVHIITAPLGVCECGSEGGTCIEILANRIVNTPEIEEEL